MALQGRLWYCDKNRGGEDDISMTVKKAIKYRVFLNVEQVLFDLAWILLHHFILLWTVGNVDSICQALHK